MRSGLVGKMKGGSLVGRYSHTLFDASTPGDKTWLRLHNPKHNPMNPRCQAISTPRANKNNHD